MQLYVYMCQRRCTYRSIHVVPVSTSIHGPREDGHTSLPALSTSISIEVCASACIHACIHKSYALRVSAVAPVLHACGHREASVNVQGSDASVCHMACLVQAAKNVDT